MPYKVFIPAELDKKYPELTIEQKRWIVQAYFRHFGEVTGKGGQLNFKIPHVGTFKTHGNKKSCFQTKKYANKQSVIMVRKSQQKRELTKDFLLF